ncbi:MAG: metallophosphoesterase family protein [Chloroflexi bacterium]|nr:metallophosphoesterase family protein [Chloroflexota bacterium]
MTRIAILADIHGNLPALEAVLRDLEQVAPDQVVVNGDIVNRGPQSQECLDIVRDKGWPVVFGNHEEYLIQIREGEAGAEWYTDWALPTRCVAEDLTDDDVEYLENLPHDYVIDLPKLPALRIVHGSMRALNAGLGFWMSDAELLSAVEGADEPLVVGAHTHRPLDRRVGERWILNSGAVGAPFNGNPDAQYLVLEATNSHWEADFRAVPYNRRALYEAWMRTGLLRKSMSAQVFMYEVETATFHMASYIRFCNMNKLPQNDYSSFERYRIASRYVTPGRSLVGGG